MTLFLSKSLHVAITKYHRFEVLKNKYFFLPVQWLSSQRLGSSQTWLLMGGFPCLVDSSLFTISLFFYGLRCRGDITISIFFFLPFCTKSLMTSQGKDCQFPLKDQIPDNILLEGICHFNCVCVCKIYKHLEYNSQKSLEVHWMDYIIEFRFCMAWKELHTAFFCPAVNGKTLKPF